MKPLCPPTGPTSARIMIVGEAPGVEEERQLQPFVGASGMELTKMLHDAGIMRTECFITNVCRERPPSNKIENFFPNKTAAKKMGIAEHWGRYPLPPIHQGLALLAEEIKRVKPTLIIALGNTALWALTGEEGVGNWRGSVLPLRPEFSPSVIPIDTLKTFDTRTKICVKVVPTYHPAAVLRMWAWRNIAVHDLRRAAEEVKTVGILTPDYKFSVRPSFQEVMYRIMWLGVWAKSGTRPHEPSNPGVLYVVDPNPPGDNPTPQNGTQDAAPPFRLRLSVDIETRLRHIACVGFAWSNTEALCIPLMCVENDEGYWSADEEVAIVLACRRLFEMPEVEIIGQNFLYDMQYLTRYWGLNTDCDFDTMLAQHVCYPGVPKGLDFLSSMYCDFHQYWKGEGKNWDPRYVAEEQLWVYNCKDAVITYEVAGVLERVIEHGGLQEVFDFQMSLFRPVLDMMLLGTRMNVALKGEFGLKLMNEMGAREQWFHKIVGDVSHLLVKKVTKKTKPWYRSPTQTQKLLYEVWGLPKQFNRKTGRPTADVEALTRLSAKEPIIAPVLRVLEEYRSLGIFLSTFVNAALEDGRIRCSFNIGGTETYRFASSEDAFGFGTNLQTIPAGNKEE